MNSNILIIRWLIDLFFNWTLLNTPCSCSYLCVKINCVISSVFKTLVIRHLILPSFLFQCLFALLPYNQWACTFHLPFSDSVNAVWSFCSYAEYLWPVLTHTSVLMVSILILLHYSFVFPCYFLCAMFWFSEMSVKIWS